MNILEEANEITSKQRRQDYGEASTSFTNIANMWSVIIGYNVTAQQVAMCMIALKISRFLHGGQRDSLVDIAGYARVIEMMGE